MSLTRRGRIAAATTTALLTAAAVFTAGYAVHQPHAAKPVVPVSSTRTVTCQLYLDNGQLYADNCTTP